MVDIISGFLLFGKGLLLIKFLTKSIKNDSIGLLFNIPTGEIKMANEQMKEFTGPTAKNVDKQYNKWLRKNKGKLDVVKLTSISIGGGKPVVLTVEYTKVAPTLKKGCGGKCAGCACKSPKK